MQKSFVAMIGALALCTMVVLLWGNITRDSNANQNPDRVVVVVRWEYKTLSEHGSTTLNSVGAEGWELVSSVYDPSARVVHFLKRRIIK
jgi:hypothetical protein